MRRRRQPRPPLLKDNQGGKALKWLPAHFNFKKRNTPKSVSYTHLKAAGAPRRLIQLLYRGQGGTDHGHHRQLGDAVPWRYGIGAVSYTHLDVYKRQGLGL